MVNAASVMVGKSSVLAVESPMMIGAAVSAIIVADILLVYVLCSSCYKIMVRRSLGSWKDGFTKVVVSV